MRSPVSPTPPRRTFTASSTRCKVNVALAIDEANSRLFVACRSGQVVVFDTQTGKELDSLPITKGVDDSTYDAASKRVYASGDGSVDVYEQTDPDHYKLLGKVPTGDLSEGQHRP